MTIFITKPYEIKNTTPILSDVITKISTNFKGDDNILVGEILDVEIINTKDQFNHIRYTVKD